MKLKIDGIIFDFDGVIVDSGMDIASAVRHSLQHFGRPVLPIGEIISYVGAGMEVLIRKSFKDCPEEVIQKAMPYYKQYYLENCIVETRLYDHFKEMLEYFKHKKMAVFTNKPEALTKKILEGFGILDYFSILVGPESVRELKPHPEGLEKILADFGIRPAQALMIGDTNTDIEVGRLVGTHTCGVTYGLGDTGRLIAASPDILIDDIQELIEYIE